MFGFQGGESEATLARKKAYMKEAQQLWPFLTNFDLSTIKSEPQLVSIVKDRTSLPRAEAERRVRAWTADKRFSSGEE